MVEGAALSAGATVYAVVVGLKDLVEKDALRDFTLRNESLKWLAVVWGLMEILPGFIFFGYENTTLTPISSIFCLGGSA